LVITLLILVVGFFIFLSASLGLLARNGEIFGKVALKQLIYAFVIGLPALYIGSRIPFERWRKAALPLFVISALSLLLVFVPKIGFGSGGAKRWVDIMGISFQPAEFIKLGLVLYLSLWYTNIKSKIETIRFGIVPLLIMLGVPSVILALQPDNGTILVLIVTAVSIYLVAGGKIKHLLSLGLVLILVFCFAAYTRPYVKSRIMTFMDPDRDPLGASYQARQALIAVGSGEVFGRGFGQSVQKFNYLPEPVSDSIFAVAAEEFGFIGSSVLLLMFAAFTLRGLKIASNSKDQFARLTAIGIVILITSQSLINIGAMLGVLPISGMPLIFVSQGGTAIVFALFEVGMLLQISRHCEKSSKDIDHE